jgi:small subunit ribosomal protein S4e
MKAHLKRQKVPKSWPIARKGNTYVVKAKSKGIPLLIALRDILNLAQNKKEVKQAIHKKDILISGKIARDEKNSIELFDILTIIPSKENYQLNLSNFGKYIFNKIEEKNTKIKIAKIIGKKSLKSKKTQLNLLDGRNYLSENECKVNDSVIIDLTKNKISKILILKEKANILAIGGKHAGITGKIEKIIPQLKMVEINDGKKKFRILIKQLMVVQ